MTALDNEEKRHQVAKNEYNDRNENHTFENHDRDGADEEGNINHHCDIQNNASDEDKEVVSLIINNENDDDNPNNNDEDEPVFGLMSPNTNNNTNPTVFWIIGLSIVLESITCFLRFGLHLQSTRDTAQLSKYTFGLRIHHGYIGVLILLFSSYYYDGCSCNNRHNDDDNNIVVISNNSEEEAEEYQESQQRQHNQHYQHDHDIRRGCRIPQQHFCFRVIGWSLIISDLMHHFLILWPITGDPHFDIFYPK